MSLILDSAAWVTQASDFITQNWTKLLGILGGTSGIVAIIMLFAKLFIILLQARVNKKGAAPLADNFNAFESEFMANWNAFVESVQEMQERYAEQLQSTLCELIEKSQKMKVALYDKLMDEGESAQRIYENLTQKVDELYDVQKEQDETQEEKPIEEPTAQEQEMVLPIAEKPPKKKNKKVIVER